MSANTSAIVTLSHGRILPACAGGRLTSSPHVGMVPPECPIAHARR